MVKNRFAVGSKRKQTISQILFDTYTIIVQDSTENPLKVSMLFLSGCFILKFLYTCVMTERMIVPPAPYIKETLTKLLEDGYKIISPGIQQRFETIPNFSLLLRNMISGFFEEAIRAEGFSGNIHSDEYWTKPIWQRRYSTIAEYERALDKQLESEMGIRYVVDMPSLLIYKKLIRRDLELKPLCHQVKKSYLGATAFVWMEHSMENQKIQRVLNLLLYESGVR